MHPLANITTAAATHHVLRHDVVGDVELVVVDEGHPVLLDYLGPVAVHLVLVVEPQRQGAVHVPRVGRRCLGYHLQSNGPT
jgi:hypothetical protein